jgi:hypothetical protein
MVHWGFLAQFTILRMWETGTITHSGKKSENPFEAEILVDRCFRAWISQTNVELIGGNLWGHSPSKFHYIFHVIVQMIRTKLEHLSNNLSTPLSQHFMPLDQIKTNSRPSLLPSKFLPRAK